MRRLFLKTLLLSGFLCSKIRGQWVLKKTTLHGTCDILGAQGSSSVFAPIFLSSTERYLFCAQGGGAPVQPFYNAAARHLWGQIGFRCLHSLDHFTGVYFGLHYETQLSTWGGVLGGEHRFSSGYFSASFSPAVATFLKKHWDNPGKNGELLTPFSSEAMLRFNAEKSFGFLPWLSGHGQVAFPGSVFKNKRMQWNEVVSGGILVRPGPWLEAKVKWSEWRLIPSLISVRFHLKLYQSLRQQLRLGGHQSGSKAMLRMPLPEVPQPHYIALPALAEQQEQEKLIKLLQPKGLSSEDRAAIKKRLSDFTVKGLTFLQEISQQVKVVRCQAQRQEGLSQAMDAQWVDKVPSEGQGSLWNLETARRVFKDPKAAFMVVLQRCFPGEGVPATWTFDLPRLEAFFLNRPLDAETPPAALLPLFLPPCLMFSHKVFLKFDEIQRFVKKEHPLFYEDWKEQLKAYEQSENTPWPLKTLLYELSTPSYHPLRDAEDGLALVYDMHELLLQRIEKEESSDSSTKNALSSMIAKTYEDVKDLLNIDASKQGENLREALSEVDRTEFVSREGEYKDVDHFFRLWAEYYRCFVALYDASVLENLTSFTNQRSERFCKLSQRLKDAVDQLSAEQRQLVGLSDVFDKLINVLGGKDDYCMQHRALNQILKPVEQGGQQLPDAHQKTFTALLEDIKKELEACKTHPFAKVVKQGQEAEQKLVNWVKRQPLSVITYLQDNVPALDAFLRCSRNCFKQILEELNAKLLSIFDAQDQTQPVESTLHPLSDEEATLQSEKIKALMLEVAAMFPDGLLRQEIKKAANNKITLYQLCRTMSQTTSNHEDSSMAMPTSEKIDSCLQHSFKMLNVVWNSSTVTVEAFDSGVRPTAVLLFTQLLTAKDPNASLDRLTEVMKDYAHLLQKELFP